MNGTGANECRGRVFDLRNKTGRLESAILIAVHRKDLAGEYQRIAPSVPQFSRVLVCTGISG